MDKLILLVGNPNQSFVQSEIVTFSKLVKQLYVYAHVPDVLEYTLPNNVHYKVLTSVKYKHSKVGFQLIKIMLIDLWKHKFNWKYLQAFRHHYSTLRQANYLAEELSKQIDSETMILTFWCDIWAIALGLLKTKQSSQKVFSRAHGRDLYEERLPSIIKAIPFRPFVMKQLNGVFPISKDGTDYLIKKYPTFTHKIKTNYLGCPDFNVCDQSPSTFTILSIATIRHVKQIHRIAEVVRDFPTPIHWVHIGGEANRKKDETIAYTESVVNEIKNQSHKQVSMLGAILPNDLEKSVLRFQPHVLVNTSEYEGLPVSIMEALSFGIPIIATDVGGTRELIEDGCSQLLKPNFSNKELQTFLIQIKNAWNTGMRDAAKTYWQQKLGLESNREKLLKLMHVTK